MELFIKQEPVDAIDFNEVRSCCLCEEGNAIQNQLLEHFRKEHPQGKNIWNRLIRWSHEVDRRKRASSKFYLNSRK